MITRRPTKRLRRCLAAIGCMGLLGLQVWVRAEPQSQDGGTGAPRPRASRVTNEDDEAKAKRIEKQLDEILAVQEAILKRYDELMEELQIIKIRATQ